MRAAVSAAAGNSLCSGCTGPVLKKAVVLRLHLVTAGVYVDHHIRPRRRDPSLGDADEVVQPTVAFVIGLEPADEVLPSRLIALEEGSMRLPGWLSGRAHLAACDRPCAAVDSLTRPRCLQSGRSRCHVLRRKRSPPRSRRGSRWCIHLPRRGHPPRSSNGKPRGVRDMVLIDGGPDPARLIE